MLSVMTVDIDRTWKFRESSGKRLSMRLGDAVVSVRKVDISQPVFLCSLKIRLGTVDADDRSYSDLLELRKSSVAIRRSTRYCFGVQLESVGKSVMLQTLRFPNVARVRHRHSNYTANSEKASIHADFFEMKQ